MKWIGRMDISFADILASHGHHFGSSLPGGTDGRV